MSCIDALHHPLRGDYAHLDIRSKGGGRRILPPCVDEVTDGSCIRDDQGQALALSPR
jgi:hypothetical protein